jgi:hypothetical protein
VARVAQRQGVIKGILLHQGESNTNYAAWPEKVAKIHRNLLADLGLDAARVPLLAGETVNADQQGAAASVNGIIARLPQAVPTARVLVPGDIDQLPWRAGSRQITSRRELAIVRPYQS